MKKTALIIFILLMVIVPSVFSARWIKDYVYLQTDTVGKVEFSHYTHMEMESIGRNCPTCHNDIYNLVPAKNPAYTMTEMEEGKACGACHNDEMAFSVTENCTICHAGEIVYKDEDAGDVTFPHSVHIEMFGCDDCHPDLFKAERGANPATMEDMENGESCGACHDGDTAFGVAEDCESCHAM